MSRFGEEKSVEGEEKSVDVGENDARRDGYTNDVEEIGGEHEVSRATSITHSRARLRREKLTVESLSSPLFSLSGLGAFSSLGIDAGVALEEVIEGAREDEGHMEEMARDRREGLCFRVGRDCAVTRDVVDSEVGKMAEDEVEFDEDGCFECR